MDTYESMLGMSVSICIRSRIRSHIYLSVSVVASVSVSISVVVFIRCCCSCHIRIRIRSCICIRAAISVCWPLSYSPQTLRRLFVRPAECPLRREEASMPTLEGNNTTPLWEEKTRTHHQTKTPKWVTHLTLSWTIFPLAHLTSTPWAMAGSRRQGLCKLGKNVI